MVASSAAPRRDQRTAVGAGTAGAASVSSGHNGRTRKARGRRRRFAHGMALDAVDGPLRGQRIAVVGPRFQIGADNNNELRITTDTYLSGMHARIEQSQGQWTVIDLDRATGRLLTGVA